MYAGSEWYTKTLTNVVVGMRVLLFGEERRYVDTDVNSTSTHRPALSQSWSWEISDLRSSWQHQGNFKAGALTCEDVRQGFLDNLFLKMHSLIIWLICLFTEPTEWPAALLVICNLLTDCNLRYWRV